jgi:hypothetical protein
MQRSKSRRREETDVPRLDRLTLTYATGVVVLMILNLAGYGLIAATV